MPPRKRPWFRFYVEMIWDRKIRRLPVSTRWLFAALLACARSSPVPGTILLTEGDPMTVEDIADAAALPRKDVVKGIEALKNVGVIDTDTNTCALFVTRWTERQFESDDTALRTAKHRSKERSNNGDVTHQIQRTDTETEIPPTPAERGLRANGTSPRQTAWRTEIESYQRMMALCQSCGSNPNFDCGDCSLRKRKIGELQTKIRELAGA